MSAQPLATDSLELRVLEGSTPKTSFVILINSGILDPPPTSSTLCIEIHLDLRYYCAFVSISLIFDQIFLVILLKR
jgi:hypothetical protein